MGNHVNFQFTFVLEALSTFLTNLNNTIYQRYNIHYVFDIWFFFLMKMSLLPAKVN